VIDGEEIEKSSSYNNYGKLDFSWVWQNTLEKEMGKCRVFDISHIKSSIEGSREEIIADPDAKPAYSEIFRKANAVIITSSVKNPTEELISEAYKFISAGNVIILDMPSYRWNRLMEREIVPGDVEIKNISGDSGIDGISPRILPLTVSEHLEYMPLNTRIKEIDTVPDDLEVLFRIDGRPAFIQFGLSKGWVLFLFFDFAMQMTSIRQGIPSKSDYTVKKRLSHIPFIKESEDMAINGNMLKKLHPYADILEKFLFSAIEDLVSFPRLWYYPYKYDGVFMMTHDDEKRGKSKSMYMADEELSRGYRSTFFIICSPGVETRWKNAKKDIIKKGFDVQWHWNRFPDNFRIHKPEEQVENFKKLPGVNLTSCRIHFLNWGNHYTKPFRVMENLGISLDTTYGPNRGRGYLFGTGMPFHPIETDGNLFSLYEIPFQTQEDWAGVDIDYFRKLFKNSREIYHSVIIPIFHPHKVARGKGRDLWLGSFELAKEHKHWITTFSEFGDFYKKRCSIEMKTTDNGGRKPEVGGEDNEKNRIFETAQQFIWKNEENEKQITSSSDNNFSTNSGRMPSDIDNDLHYRIITDAGRRYILIPVGKLRNFNISFLRNLYFKNIPEEMEDIIALRISGKYLSMIQNISKK